MIPLMELRAEMVSFAPDPDACLSTEALMQIIKSFVITGIPVALLSFLLFLTQCSQFDDSKTKKESDLIAPLVIVTSTNTPIHNQMREYDPSNGISGGDANIIRTGP